MISSTFVTSFFYHLDQDNQHLCSVIVHCNGQIGQSGDILYRKSLPLPLIDKKVRRVTLEEIVPPESNNWCRISSVQEHLWRMEVTATQPRFQSPPAVVAATRWRVWQEPHSCRFSGGSSSPSWQGLPNVANSHLTATSPNQPHPTLLPPFLPPFPNPLQ